MRSRPAEAIECDEPPEKLEPDCELGMRYIDGPDIVVRELSLGGSGARAPSTRDSRRSTIFAAVVTRSALPGPLDCVPPRLVDDAKVAVLQLAKTRVARSENESKDGGRKATQNAVSTNRRHTSSRRPAARRLHLPAVRS